MIRFERLTAALVVLFACAGIAGAQGPSARTSSGVAKTGTLTPYFDEASFLAAVAGATTIHEGFEGTAWDGVRSTIAGGTNAAPSVNSQGIWWASDHPGNGITTGGGAARGGSWGVYSYPHGDQTVPNPTDQIFDGFGGSSSSALIGVGGYFTGTFGSDLVVVVDGIVPPTGLGPVDSGFQFYGVVMTGGTFSSFEFWEIEGTKEDQKLIFADDFIIAVDAGGANNPPNGTIVQPAGNPTINVNQSVTFQGSASDPDGDTVSVLWQFGDGGTSTALSPGAHTYTSPGVFTVTLTATDQYGYADPTPDTRTVTVNNTAPNGTIVQPAGNPTIEAGQSVTFQGSASDPDGDAVSVLWQFGDGGTSTLLTPGVHVYGTAGLYTVTLTATDGHGLADPTPATRTVTVNEPPNTPPTADAGPDQTAFVTDTVTLDGSASSDADSDPLAFAWSFSSRPTGSTATLTGATTVSPSFVVDEPGTYIVQLIVNDGAAGSAPDTVTISTQNSPPVANAGPDQSALVGQTVTLDGSASTDVDGDPLGYAWSFSSKPAASTAMLSGATTISPGFVIDEPGSYVVQLIVNDGAADSAPDTVTISTDNSAPVADAGADQSALVGQTITLDGSASTDADGDPLGYSWSFSSRPAGSTATLSGAATVSPSFAIDEPGTYIVQLIVNDGTADSTADHVHITTSNSAPVADAGADQSALVGQTVALDGSASTDADGDPLGYSWSFSSRPAGSTATLSGAATVSPSFVIDEPGTYIVQLIVNDGTVDSAADHVHISTDNSAPVANAGPDQSALVGQSVTLDGSASSDVDGDPLDYAWSFSSRPTGSTATLTGAATVSPSFVVDQPGTYIVQLMVNDGTVDSAADHVHVSTDNTPPVANAGPDQTVPVAGTAQLDGSGSSDVDNDALTYSWSFSSKPAGSATALSDPTAMNPSFVVDEAGTYAVRLIVHDATVSSAPDTVVISTSNSAPVADAGPARTVAIGTTVHLDGSGSSDANGDPLTYSWSFSFKPAGSVATLTGPITVSPSFVVDQPGRYVVQLIVHDGTVSSAPDTVTVRTTNTPPNGVILEPAGDVTVDAGQPVYFEGSVDDPEGDSVSVLWNFGDGTTSSALVPGDHVYTDGGSYLVTFLATDSSGDPDPTPDTRTITVVGGAGPPEMDGVVAGVADIRGLQGSDWHTDLYLHNGGDGDVVVDLYYSPSRGTIGEPVTLTVTPDRTEALRDVVSSVFGVEGSGAIFWRVSAGDGARLLVTANTFNRVDEVRSYGQQVPGVRWSGAAAVGEPLLVPAIAGPYRTNLGFATDGDCTRVRIRGFDRLGALQVERTISVSPHTWVQLTGLFRREFPDLVVDPDTIAVEDSLHVFEVTGVDGRIVAYTSVADNVTNDGSYLLALRPAASGGSVWLPGAALTRGVNDSRWRSDLIAVNTADGSDQMACAFYPSSADNSVVDDRHTEQLLAHQAMFSGNVLDSMLGLRPPRAGSLEVSASTSLFWMRTYTEATDPDHGFVTYGQAIAAVGPDDVIGVGGEGRVFGFSYNDRTRSNLVLQNTCADAAGDLLPVTVQVELLDRMGIVVHTRSYELRPGEYLQHNGFVADTGVGWITDAAIRVTPSGHAGHAGGGVAAMVSEVNGADLAGTNDGRLIRAQIVR